MAFDFSNQPYDLRAGPGERLIHLTREFVALIDGDDYPLVSQYSWHAHAARSKVYARSRCRETGVPLYMHRLIVGLPGPGLVVDHRDGISLNCTRDNLRVCGFDKNAQNANYPNKLGYRGVTQQRSKFLARICVDGQTRRLGLFGTAAEAAAAYDEAALKAYGPFAWTNFKRDLRPQASVLEELPF